MESNQIFVLALANVPTILTVLIGIMLDSKRFNALSAQIASMESRLDRMDTRLMRIEGQRR